MSDVEASVPQIGAKKSCHFVIRTIFHMFCFVLYGFCLLYGFVVWFTITEKHIQQPLLKDLKGLAPFFFTNWNFLFQTVFLGLSVFHDILEWLNKRDSTLASRIKYWRDVIFGGMVVPFTLFVTSMFWCVYGIDRELVFPKVYDEVVPWWFNHCVHTNITIMIIIETILQSRRYPTNRKLELILYWTVAFSYAIVYYTIYFSTNKWLYQVFGIMTWWQVCLYQLLIWVGSYIFYELQYPINRLLHKVNDVPENKVETKVETDDNKFSKCWSNQFRNVNRNENSRL